MLDLMHYYDPTRDATANVWERKKYNQDLEEEYVKENIESYNEAIQLRWTGHVLRSGDYRVFNMIFWKRPDGTRCIDRPGRR